MTTALFYGDWDQAKRFVRKSQRGAILREFRSVLQDLGEAVVRKLDAHITAQDLNWIPLQPATLAGKRGTLIYVASGKLRGSLGVKVIKMGSMGIRLDITPKGEHGGGISNETLWSWMEYGTSGMKARPLWRPTFAEIPDMVEFKALEEAATEMGFN